MTPGRCKVYVGVLIPKDITAVSQTHKEKKNKSQFQKNHKEKNMQPDKNEQKQ